MHYTHPSEIMDEIAALTPSFRRQLREARALAACSGPATRHAPEGTPIMHVDSFVRGKGRSSSPYVPTDEKVTALPADPDHRAHPVAVQRGRADAAHRERWHDEDRLEIHPHDAEERGIREGDWVGMSRAGETVLRATVTERMQPGVVYTTFHFPESGANVITTDNSDWATNCPEYKVTAVQVCRCAARARLTMAA
jgi:formate dehydrogenase major subunit